MKPSSLIAFIVSFSFSVSANNIDVGFSSNRTAENLVIKTIDSANKQILFAAYSFTNKNIADSLVAAKKRGVSVFAVLDKSQLTEKYSAATFLLHAKIPVRIDTQHAIMHNKYMIVDSKTVETGSFNYTSSATKRNAENVIVIWGDEKIASDYSNDWKFHWDHAEHLE
mgnify:CR=1 FL=1